MGSVISQRELRNDSGRVMDRVEQGERITITRRGVPVAELVPAPRRRALVPLREAAAALQDVGPIDYLAMRAEADELFDDDGDRI